MTDSYKITDPEEQKVTPGPGGPHPGPFILEELLKPYKVSVKRAAELMSINRAHFVGVLAGRAPVSRTLAYKLEALVGISADMLIGMQALYDRGQEYAERIGYRETIQRLTLPEAKED